MRSAPELVTKIGPDGETYHPWAEFQKSGALWLVNATLWHPRGYQMTSYYEDGEDWDESVGYKIIGEGKRPWTYPADLKEINDAFTKFKALYP